MKNKEYIYEYHAKTKLGRAMLMSNNIPDSDLLFIIPNNVKKLHGLPTTRIQGKKKLEKKRRRKTKIMSFNLFDIIEELIEKELYVRQNEMFNKFVDFDVAIGE